MIENGYILHDTVDLCAKNVPDTKFPIFVSMGRMERVKGFDLLIRAFQKVYSVIPEAQLWLIGDGSLRSELEKECRERGLEHAIKILGYIKNPHEVLQHASIYVLSSRNEGLPNALIEALNALLPVISVDCVSGPREILTGQYTERNAYGIEYAPNGVLVENFPDEDERVEHLAKAMVELAKNPEMQEAFRNKAAQRAMEFSLDAYVEKMRNMLNSL